MRVDVDTNVFVSAALKDKSFPALALHVVAQRGTFLKSRGVQAASAFAGNRNATPSSRFFSAKRRLSFWAEGASGAPGGRAPKRYRRQPGERLIAGRRKTVREGSFPDGRDAARPGAPVAQKPTRTGA